MYVTFVICFAFMAVCGVVFAAAADVLGYVFTNDREVIAATAEDRIRSGGVSIGRRRSSRGWRGFPRYGPAGHRGGS